MQVPNFGLAIFLIGHTKWIADNDFAGAWVSNIYSDDEYWRGSRWLDYGQKETTMMTKTVRSNLYESIPTELLCANLSSDFVGPDGEYRGFRDYAIHDRFCFSVTSYDYHYNLRGKEVFFAISEPATTDANWRNMLSSCSYWESTITNYQGEIVGHRKIHLSGDLVEITLTSREGRLFAQEYSRKITKKKVSACGGIEQLKRLFVIQDQALILGDRNPKVSASGIILDTQKSLDFHLNQAKKANIKKGFN